MKILYVHGFGSCFKPDGGKIATLEKLGDVVGMDVDYTAGFRSVSDALLSFTKSEDVDLIIGTSMGGYMATHLSQRTHKPFVALNPAILPKQSLVRHLGDFVDYQGVAKHLTQEVIDTYPDVGDKGRGIVLLEAADDVIDPYRTQKLLSDIYPVHLFENGSHRFESLEDHLDLIRKI